MTDIPREAPRRLPPASTAETASFSSLWHSVLALVDSFLHLLSLEVKQSATSLIYMLAFGLAAAVLVITGWLALVACVVLALVQYEVVGWAVALIIAAVLSFAGSGLLVVLLLRRSKGLLFIATRRQLEANPSSSVTEHGKTG